MESKEAARRAKDRSYFIGGSDARIIMGDDEAALVRLWQEKRGEIEPQDLSGNLIVQLGLVTEDLNRQWHEANTGQVITDVQRRVFHPALKWMAATLDGRVQGSEAVFEAKFMLPWSFSEEAAAAKYMPQLQHNMWVVAARTAVLSVITGGGKWVEILSPCRPALSASYCDCRAEVLALCRERRGTKAVRGRAAKTADRSHPHRRHEQLQCLGGVRWHLWPYPAGSSRP